MQVTFWGVRGSIPTPGAQTSRWGGNSSCLELRHEGLPPLVLDCGTGARPLGMKLVRERCPLIHILFTHFHLDHVFGFPFFVPIYAPNQEIAITAPGYSDAEVQEKLALYMNGVLHPSRIRDIPCGLSFHAVRPGRAFERDGWKITGVGLNHPGGSIGYRIEAGGRSICYVTDTAPFAKPGEGVAADKEPTPAEHRILRFLDGADMVIFDTMFDLHEYLEKMTWGHSYPDYAHALCRKADVGRLILFHHAPEADDDALDAREVRWSDVEQPRVSLAREGATLNVEG